MPPRTTPKTVRSKLDALRLLVAREIIRYSINRGRNPAHISGNADVIELCEQYSLKIFLNWLATKNGFDIYAECIQPALGLGTERRCGGSGWQNFRDRYPFYTVFESEFEHCLHDTAFSWLEENVVADTELVGLLYMRTMSAPLCIAADVEPVIERLNKSRIKGEFYTPLHVVRYCVEQVAPRITSTDCTIFDPACGTGNFLLGTIRHLSVAAEQASAVQLAISASRRIYGTDIDGRAIALAQASLFLEFARLAHDSCSETLNAITQNLFENLRVADGTAPTDRTFDVIFSNPPYISFGARNQPTLPKSADKYLRSQFQPSAEYKIRMHSVFQEVCVRSSSEQGDVILLVPDAFLNGSYYQKLRTFLLEETTIVSLTEFPDNTFDDATVGRWCVAHYRTKSRGAEHTGATERRGARSQRRGAPASDGHTLLRRVNEHAQIVEEFATDKSDLVSNDKNRFQLVFNDVDLGLFRQLRNNPTVSSAFRGHTGIRSRSGQANIVSSTKSGANFKKGLTSGASIIPHRVHWERKWIDTTKEKLFGGGHDARIIEQPKILMRQTADRLVAAVDLDHLYHLNNIHTFAAKENKGCDGLFWLCGIFNSRLANYLYQLKSRETKRALAQIDIEMVEALPLPADGDESRAAIVALAKALATAREADMRKLSRALDRLIYDAYRISEHDVQYIDSAGSVSDDAALPHSDAAWELVNSVCSGAILLRR